MEIWSQEIDEEEKKKEQEAIAHALMLKQREQRKLEIERAWRPTKAPATVTGQKRKNSDSLEAPEVEQPEETTTQVQQTVQQTEGKPGLSPLLTSLLKSPSQVQNVQTSSILHSAITSVNTSPKPATTTNQTIASLLNSSSGITNVSPQLQQLVSSAIGQEQVVLDEQTQAIANDILADPNLPDIKIDVLANSILVQDGPLPEIKKEEVDDIISEIIENAHDIVTDPEQHLQIDRNGDININLELDDFDDDPQEEPQIPEPAPEVIKEVKEERIPTPTPAPAPVVMPIAAPTALPIVEPATEVPTVAVTTPALPPQAPVVEKQEPPSVDPFEFQEDPVIFEPTKPLKQTEPKQYQQQPAPQPIVESPKPVEEIKTKPETAESREVKTDGVTEEVPKKVEKSGGSVEIVEVVGEDEEVNKQLNKSQIQDIVHTSATTDLESPPKPVEKDESKEVEVDTKEVAKVVETKPEPIESTPESKDTTTGEESSETSDADTKSLDIKKEINLEIQDSLDNSIVTTDLTQELYDDINMEVKVDKTGKAKRDYSRTKKKEEKGFDMLLAIEKAHLDESDLAEENSDKELLEEKKDIKLKPKIENERSSSPWTEEEDTSSVKTKRRYSTPATPVDSVPNSPASSITFEDDKDYRNWKKSVMLVFNRLATNKYASLFLKPITDDQAPGYSNLVYRPMDLQTIKKNIENGHIRTSLEFKRDIMLMFNNAIMYNKTNDTVYNMAKQMQQESMQAIEILLQASIQADGPLRRETRTSESGTKRKRNTTEDNVKNKKRKED